MDNHPLLGVDLGGTKIALSVLSPNGDELYSTRCPAPKGDYQATLFAIKDLVLGAESHLNRTMNVGIGMPGSISPKTKLVQNSNSTWLNGKPFHHDLAHCLNRKIRTANDANCLALSEAVDGVAQGAQSVFGVIIGTGCGGGLVQDGKLIQGHRHIGGEWGHVPLPWMNEQELALLSEQHCWCGQKGCLETWISGSGLAAGHLRATGQDITAEAIYEKALTGDKNCKAGLESHTSQLARGLAMIINIFDPEVIVLGGGLSKMPHLYKQLPEATQPYIFSDDTSIDIRPPKFGDASGVRGAARLWQ